MMADRRRYSPEGSNRIRKEPRRSEYDEASRMRPGATVYLSSSASSSSSYELIDISHTFPANKSGIRTFFTAPSERRRLRRRRSSRLFKLNNSSSSSINSDLAYGTGYLKKHKHRGIRSRKGKEIDRERERYSQREREREKHSYSDRERASGSERRGNTNAEILAVGAGLAKLARDQNKLDLKAGRNGKKSEVFAVKETTHHNNGGSRGLGSSRISHGSDSFDEEGWESASDAESDFSVDSKLAFGEENKGGWGIWGNTRQGPLSRKNSVVDPRLFGPANSLHGIVTEPVGFDDVSWTPSSDFGQRATSVPIGPNESLSGSQTSLQKVYPVPTTDPSRFEAARSSVASGSEPYISSRPGPAPLQHPQPITPVSQAIYEPQYSARSESGGILKKTQSSTGRSKSLAEAALVGVAGAAIGAAIVSDRKDDRKDKYRDDAIREEDRLRRRDSDKKETKDERRRDKRDSPDRDDRKEKRRDKDRQKDSSRYSSDDLRREKKREKRRDSGRDDGKDDKRERRREERRGVRSDVSKRDDRYDDRRTKSEAAVSTVSTVDPFMFQVDDNAFSTPTAESSHGHRRNESVPTVVTVEREPDFTRKRSSSIKDIPSRSKTDPSDDYHWEDTEKRNRDSRDRTFHNAEDLYQETEHSTAPIAAAAMGAAVAAVAAESYRSSRSDKRRDERRSGRGDYDDQDRDSKSRGREPERDPIQEEADKAYREIVMARKIASQVIRSRSASPSPSVVDKYDDNEEAEIIRIVTPPGMEDHKKKGPYDAPNADFRPDYEIKNPRDLRNFSLPSISDRSNPEASNLKRDPDAIKPRPLLNLVYPTPSPSPLPEKQVSRSETGRSSKSKDRGDSSRSDTARSEPSRSSKTKDRDQSSRSETGKFSKSKDREDTTRSESARSEPSRKSKDREDVTRSEAAWSEPARSTKSKDREDISRSEISRSSKSKDRDETPRPESAWSDPSRSSKSKDNDDPTRSETAWSEPARSSKIKDREEQIRTSASEVTSGNGTSSPTSKGVTWGRNETKHFEVESPSDHKDEFVSSAEVKSHENPSEPKSAAKSQSGGWGAIAAGIIGAGAGAAAASTSETSKKSKVKEKEAIPDKPYEYRGVIVEPESPPRRRSPPSTGPKPSSAESSRVPGAFEDDLDFTATVAAGLQDTGFDPNIVINDPTFRRRDSPPGSNEPGVYKAPYAETVSDFGGIPSNVSGASRGFVMGEVASTPQDWPSVSPDNDDSVSKLSKKEQKKREKAAKRQSSDVPYFEETPTPKAEEVVDYFEPKLSKKEQKKRDKEAKRQSSLAEEITPTVEPSVSQDLVEEPESYFEPAKKSKKKSKRDSKSFDDIEDTSSPEASRDGRKVSVPVDAFDDLQNEDEWAQPKSKKKSKRDSDRYDSPARSIPSEVGSELERSASKKLKDKSKRKSVDQYEPDPTEVSLPASTPSETSRDGDYDDRKSRKSSSRDSGVFDSVERSDSRSVVSTRYDDESRKSKKKSRSSTKDDFDDTRSVATAPVGDDEDSKKSKKEKKSSGSFFGLFGSKSESGARDDSPKPSKDDFEDIKKKKKSKRSSVPDAASLYGDLGATSVNDLSRSISNGQSSSKYDDDLDSGARSDGERKKTRSRADSASSKKDSFLGKAGTLGAGVGIAGAAVAIAAQHHQQSKADNAYDESERRRSRRSGKKVQIEEELDPDIKQREFRPSIDPQYGDLLPLPPSPKDPASPDLELDDLPDLPDSGPETPEDDRLKEKTKSLMRRSIQDAPIKSPSHSAVPLKFIMGNRSNPSSPGLTRPSPAQSPSTPSHDSAAFTRTRHRPTSSWESAREYKPLYLVESNRRSSQVQLDEEETPLPELPPSQRTSRSSSRLDPDDEAKGLGLDFENPLPEPHAPASQLSIDTGLASSGFSRDLLDSAQSTPKAGTLSHNLEEQPQSTSGSGTSEAIAAAGVASAISYLASSPTNSTSIKNLPDDLPPVQRQPSPIDPMTKNRSSYLLHSSPASRKDDFGPEEQGFDSPLREKSALYDDSLPSIEEREVRDNIFGSGAGLTKEAPVDEPSLPQLSRESEQVQDEPEPVDEFSFTNSKSKKRDKKKGKGLSRTSTQDDVLLPEASVSVEPQLPPPGDVEPEKEFPTPKSKKDRKEDKKKGKYTSSWEPEDTASTSQPFETPLAKEKREITEEPAPVGIEPSEDFSAPKSKKKRDKRKNKAWELEEETNTTPQVELPVADTDRESLEKSSNFDMEPSQELNALSNEDKFKSGEPEESIAQQSEYRLPEPSREIAEETATPTPAPVEADPFEDFSTPKSKKSSKKDKKKGKSSISWEPEPESEEIRPQDSQGLSSSEPTQDVASKPVHISDSFQIPETGKSGQDTEKSGQDTREPFAGQLGEVDVGEQAFQPVPEVEPDSTQQASTMDDLESFSTKKSKNRKGKSTFAWEPEQEAQVPEPSSRETEPEAPQEFEDAQEFVTTGSKKNKKKGTKGQSLTLNDNFGTEPVDEKLDELAKKLEVGERVEERDFAHETVVEPEQFVIPGSKKNKKKSRKPQSWEETPEPSRPQIDVLDAEQSVEPGAFESTPAAELPKEFTVSSSKKSKKSRKSQALDVEDEAQLGRSKQEVNPVVPEIAPEVSSTKATPMDGPTPATPWATANEFPTSPNQCYFPAATSLHSPEKGHALEDSESKGYFPSSTAVLPALAVAGAAGLAIHEHGKDSLREEDHPSELTAYKSLELDDPQNEQATAPKPTPDGLAAGYKEDQLSLARQLQEEFGPRSKKSKKKKRQSLPATPDPESSRSRIIEEPSDSHPRARSLSVGPSADSDRPQNLYSEEQLELARQMKADFEKGSKKSKKGKQNRESLEPSTRDNVYDKTIEEPTAREADFQDPTPNPEIEDATPKGDGFAAGYQEDQLSLARQLQSEFGSGSKKSKKDKKKGRSTSQTPIEQGSRDDDYFGSSAQPPALDTPYSEESTNIAEPSPALETNRNGLAVGYKEEQLELARQLKEEFGSGAKKSKDKKNKKRQSSTRANTEDDFSSTFPAEEPDSAPHSPAPETLEPESFDQQAAEPEDEFAFVKKDKKGKKGKKRESLARSTTEDNLPSDIQEPQDVDTPQPATIQQVETPQSTDEFEFTTKKGKGKKRDKLFRSTTDDNLSLDVSAKNDKAQDTFVSQPEAVQESSREPDVTEPVDDFEFTTKKSKDRKGKKRDTSEDVQSQKTPEPSVSEPQVLEVSRPALEQDLPREPEAAEPTDEFAFTTKKSKKKGKKRESFVDFADETSADASIKDAENLGNAEVAPLEERPDVPDEAVPAAADEWAVPGKKSKKGKKNRQSIVAEDEEDQLDAEAVTTPTHANEELLTAISSTSEVVNEPADDFGFTSKKSKKNKRKGTNRSSTFDEPEQETEAKNLDLAPETQNDSGEKESVSRDMDTKASPTEENVDLPTTMPESDGATELLPSAEQGDAFEFTSKKSKKHKKRQKKEDMPLAEEPPPDLPEPTNTEPSYNEVSSLPDHAPNPEDQAPGYESFSREPALEIDTSVQPLPEAGQQESENTFDDEFSFSKNSKKDKKKPKKPSNSGSEEASGFSTPLDPLAETTNEPTEASSSKDIVQEKPSVVTEILSPAPKVDVEGTGVWDAFSTKKKDKKKKKGSSKGTSGEQSENSTPIDVAEPAEDISKPHLHSATAFDTAIAEEPRSLQLESGAPASTREVSEEPEQDEWSSFSSKKTSKKDKKKRKSGMSTPIEAIPESSEQIEKSSFEEPRPAFEKVADELQLQAEEQTTPIGAHDAFAEPEQDDRAAIPKKKSKKDKKRQSGSATPIESIAETTVPAEQPVSEPLSAAKQIGESSASAIPIASTSIEDTVQEPEQDEWSSFSTKKSKKDRKSGASTLAEEYPKSVGPFERSAIVVAPLAVIAAKDILGEPANIEKASAPIARQASRPSTPAEEVLDKSVPGKEIPDFETRSPILPAQELVDEPTPKEFSNTEEHLVAPQPPESGQPIEDEWSAFSVKKSKKDKKKRKSGLSTPAEEILEKPTETAEPSTPAVDFEHAPTIEEPTPTVPELVDDWAPISRKASKKDKRKSGKSVLLEEAPKESAEADPPSTATREIAEEPTNIEEPLNSASSQQVIEEPADDWGSYSTKKSKKDKKKRKSGLSTPAEVQEPVVASEKQQDLDIDSKPDEPWGNVESRPLETSEKGKDEEVLQPIERPPGAAYARDLVDEPTKFDESTFPTSSQEVAQEPEDEWALFSTKPSKKDKKKRRSGLSTPVEKALGDSGSQNIALESQSSTELPPNESIDGRTGDSFIPSLDEKSEGKEDAPEDDGLAFVTKSRKGKKGKGGSRVDADDNTNILSKDSTMPIESLHEPGTHTAMESLAANPVEIAQTSPSLTDKIKDTPSTSSPTSEHLRNEETDAFPSDLTRKVSKKDKRKRQATVDANMPDYPGPKNEPLTTWADEVEEAEVERKLPVIEDIAKDESLSHIALTTEASPVDDFTRPTKKGKKGKKRNSVSGSLDSPSMAESFRPPIGEDNLKEQSKEHSSILGLTAAGAALAGAAILGKSQGKESELPMSASGPTTPARKLSKKEKRKMSIDRRTPKDDMFDDPVLWEGADPKEFQESKGLDDGDDSGFWTPPREEESLPDPVSSHEPIEMNKEPMSAHDEQDTRGPPTPPKKSAWAVRQSVSTPLGFSDIPSLDHQDTASIPSKVSDPDHEDRGASFEEQPTERTPSRRNRYSTAFSDLPVVREESPVRHEADHHYGASHYPDDPNRDSAFVTGSPIPPQGAFADDHEHVRDSGVHMRDVSPAKGVRAPISSSDDAIASLAWPQVDEDAETVAINKSLRPKVVVDKYHHVESSRDSHDSHRPKEDRDIDFFRAQRPADERVEKQHHEELSGRDLLPSQRVKAETPTTELHRTRTIHKSAEERPHHHEEFTSNDLYPSHREAEKHTDLHRTKTIHGSANEQPKHRDHDVHPSHQEEAPELHRTKTIHGSEGSLMKQRVHRLESPDLRSTKPKEESSVKQRVQRIESPDNYRSSKPKEDKYAELNQSHRPKAERPQISDNDTAIAAGTAAIGAVGLGFAAARQLSSEKRPDSAQSQKAGSSNINRLRTPDPKFRPESANSQRSGTPPLRRSDRKISGDLRSLSQRSQLDLAKEAKEAELAALNNSSSTTVNTANPTANEGRVRAKDMADVYDGFGEGRMGSPRSPTRPHSMRRRQSMQVLDLESKLEQLAAENRMLAEAKAQAERTLQASGHGASSLVEKDAEIDSLKRTLDWLQNEVTRLSEVNDGLASANVTLGQQHSERYGTLEAQHAQAARELQDTRDAHSNLSTGMEGIVKNEVQRSVQEKDDEIAQLRAQLENAKDQIRAMQRQILASKAGDSDFLTIRDEDYFDTACQQLCQHVQQWVLRFSKFSDMRACRLTSEINNDKTIDRLDNAILDGSDVDSYLADRIKRRDVFMSMTMTMVWEFIFTRYLFGMDREQRQKLKSLEKLLSEVGPAAAVHQWRATTLTLLSKREAFVQQREQDTEAVIHAILETLSEILPPPSHLEGQIEEQLKRVMKAAVDLSIEMRTQRAEYMMLPPLQPEYDANGDLASKVSFNSALMNERSGDTVSNEELEAQHAVVRVVLFPLVVKKGDDSGEGDEEIVVCPAQVLVAKPKKSVRVFSPDDMAANNSRMSLQSSMPGEAGSVI